MTISGNNCRINIWSISEDTDNVVGGAMITGTVLYQNIPARFQSDREDILLFQQGLETNKTFTFTITPGYLVVHERDELEICQPIDHTYYGDRFRAVSVRHSDFNHRDPRNYLIIHATRSVEAHERQ